MVNPKVPASGSPSGTLTVVDAPTGNPISVSSGSATSYCADPQRGTLARAQFVPMSTGSVRLKVVIAAVGANISADLDHADFTRSREYGVVATRAGQVNLNPVLQ